MATSHTQSPTTPALDSKPYVRYHPTIGYEYVPNTRQTLPRPGGGTYTITINADGIRSERTFTPQKPPGVFRIIVLGDSYAAGQFLTNEHRFSELLERRIPNLEVVNLALEGTGTDQQLLIFEQIGKRYEFDLVLILPFLQNIRRNMVEARNSWDARTGKEVRRGKPRFELIDDKLELRNVPVPETLPPVESDGGGATDTASATHRLKTWINSFGVLRGLKHLVYRFIAWEPFPEYKSADTPAWKLMEAILMRLKDAAGDKPLVIAPVFYDSYIRFPMARNYWDRFSSLTRREGVYAIDLLPYFKKTGDDVARCFLVNDVHFSTHGHLILADALQDEMARLGLLPKR